jgi:hypothetical protein
MCKREQTLERGSANGVERNGCNITIEQVRGRKQYYLKAIREDIWNDRRAGADRLQSSRVARMTCKPRGGTQVIGRQPRLIRMKSCMYDLGGKTCQALAEGGYAS